MGTAVTVRRCVRRLSAAEAPVLTGSADLRLARELVRQTIEALALPEGLSRRETKERVAAAKAALAGLRPQGTLEGMLIGQMIATHAAAMACLTRAMTAATEEATAQAALRRAERLLAVYARQCDSLLRIRHARPRRRRQGGLGHRGRDLRAGALDGDAERRGQGLAERAAGGGGAAGEARAGAEAAGGEGAASRER